MKLSKSLSYILRHGAAKEGIQLDDGGFAFVDDLLVCPNLRQFTFADIKRVVENNDKQRFALVTDLDTGKNKIRANQGHTLEVLYPSYTRVRHSKGVFDVGIRTDFDSSNKARRGACGNSWYISEILGQDKAPGSVLYQNVCYITTYSKANLHPSIKPLLTCISCTCIIHLYTYMFKVKHSTIPNV